MLVLVASSTLIWWMLGEVHTRVLNCGQVWLNLRVITQQLQIRLSSDTFLSLGASLIALTFSGKGCRSWALILCQKNTTDRNIKWHLLFFKRKPAFFKWWRTLFNVFRCTPSMIPVIAISSMLTTTFWIPWMSTSVVRWNITGADDTRQTSNS